MENWLEAEHQSLTLVGLLNELKEFNEHKRPVPFKA